MGGTASPAQARTVMSAAAQLRAQAVAMDMPDGGCRHGSDNRTVRPLSAPLRHGADAEWICSSGTVVQSSGAMPSACALGSATPHLGWATVEARTRLVAQAAENLHAFTRDTRLNRID